MAKPKDTAQAAAFLLDCVRKGCLGDGDAAAVIMLLRERKAMKKDLARLSAAADDCLSLLECCDLEGSEGEGGRIEALRKALNA